MQQETVLCLEHCWDRCVNLNFPGSNTSAVEVITHTQQWWPEPLLRDSGPFLSLLGSRMATEPRLCTGRSKHQTAHGDDTDPVIPPSNQECLEQGGESPYQPWESPKEGWGVTKEQDRYQGGSPGHHPTPVPFLLPCCGQEQSRSFINKLQYHGTTKLRQLWQV